MSEIIVQSAGYAQVSASGNVWPQPAALEGIFVSSATTGTITVYDDAGTGTTIKMVDTFTVAPGTWYPLPFRALKGLNIVLGGTVSCTVGFEAETMR